MNYLYLFIDLFTFSGPFLLSFDKKVHFYSYWKALFISIAVMMMLFISNDIYFTKLGYWGFNENYLCGIKIFNLPLEECLFFIVVPYACVFIYECVLAYFQFNFNIKFIWWLWMVLALILFTASIYFYNQAYSFFSFFGSACFILLILYKKEQHFLRYFSVSFLIILIPFLVVNGLLTGTGIESEVVWYSDTAISGFRILSIPIEDVFYCLFMLLAVLIPYEHLKPKKA